MIIENIFCSCCRHEITQIEDVLVVDESLAHYFCSEECILSFYRPVMENFERLNTKLEQSVCDKLNVKDNKSIDELLKDEEAFGTLLYRPTKIFFYENSLAQKFYLHLYEFHQNGQKLFHLAFMSYYNHEPSFVFFRLLTYSVELKNKYEQLTGLKPYNKREALIDSEKEKKCSKTNDSSEEHKLPDDILEDIEMRKSEEVAKLLEAQSSDDISLQEFSDYDSYLKTTLDLPDEIYLREDECFEFTKTFIKSFKSRNISFFYIVICVEIKTHKDQDEKEKVLIPLLSFPSKDNQLYAQYAIGESLQKNVLN